MKKIFILFIAAFLICGCGKKTTEPAEKSEPQSEQEKQQVTQKESAQVLLALEKTRFKENLIEKMKSLLEKDSISVQVIEHSDKGFPVKDPSSYKAIFITISGVHSKVRPWIAEWLDENKDQEAKILLHVTQKSEWKVNADVDTVTSASIMDDVDIHAAGFTARIKAMVEKSKSGEKSADAE
jgi:hypothetical protein